MPSKQLQVPVVIIIFRRPALTQRVLKEVSKARPARLFVIADGPRCDVEGDQENVRLTRALFDDFSWNCEVTRIYSDENMGLRQRVLSGLDEVFREVDSAIILEDDCLPSQDFFYFAEELLAFYQDENLVGSISGNNFAPNNIISNSYHFSSHANIWGWATWRRTWTGFRASKEIEQLSKSEIKRILARIPSAVQKVSFHSLLRKSTGLDSWAIQFAAFCYLNELLSAVPSQNLVTNIGFGAGSTHTKFESWADQVPTGAMHFPLFHPPGIFADFAAMKRESKIKALSWLSYPICHPWSSTLRFFRFAKTYFR